MLGKVQQEAWGMFNQNYSYMIHAFKDDSDCNKDGTFLDFFSMVKTI